MMNTNRPNLVILTETRLGGDRAKNVIRTLGYERFVKVDAMGFLKGHLGAIKPTSILCGTHIKCFP